MAEHETTDRVLRIDVDATPSEVVVNGNRFVPADVTPAAPEPARVLGAAYQPEEGEDYRTINLCGRSAMVRWKGDGLDRCAHELGLIWPYTEEGAADADADLRYIAVVLRARRVARDLWKVRPAPPVGFVGYEPYLNADGKVDSVVAVAQYGPWRFAESPGGYKSGDCDRFISAMGDDIATLLGGV